MSDNSSYLTIAVIGAALGIKGWVRAQSHTSPSDNLLDYKEFWIGLNGQWQPAVCEESKAHGKTYALKLKGIDDRNQAEGLRHYAIAIKKDSLPDLADGEYYWHQLQGLKVINTDSQLFGEVSGLLETGSNDVLVVKATADSIDQRERLLPYRPECVLSVDLETKQILVDWDADF